MAFAAWLCAALLVPAASKAFDGYELLSFDGRLVKWGETALGKGAVISYALAEQAWRFPKARNCKSMIPLDGLLARSGIRTEALERELRAAFAMWERAADVRFVPAAAGALPDILIGAQARPRGIAFADVAYDQQGGRDIRSIERSLICLNPTRHWKIGFGGDLEIYDLRYALAHEIGHAIGLDHPSPSGQLMSFSYRETFRQPQLGDIGGVSALYGLRKTASSLADVPRVPAGMSREVESDQGPFEIASPETAPPETALR